MLPYKSKLHNQLLPKILHMYIGAQPGVISQVPTRMLRVFVNHNPIATPPPIIDIAKVIPRNAKETISEKESVPVPAT